MKPKHLKRGRFIVLDGPDGAGKTTQTHLLAQELDKLGIRTLMLREPGGTPAGEAIRALVLEHRKIALEPLAEAFLFQAARAQLVREVIVPALDKGEWVLCDRFSLSTLVYQGYAGGIEHHEIEALTQFATGGLSPDLYLVLWVPLKVGIERRNHRQADRMESKGDEFLKDVSNSFQKEASLHPKKYTLIDGSGGVEEVRERIWQKIEPLTLDTPGA